MTLQSGHTGTAPATTARTFITPETMRAHRASWFVWVGDGTPAYPRQKIPHTSTMRGHWPGWDVTCSCGQFETKTGGATRTHVDDKLWHHRFAAQAETSGEV